MAQFKSFPSDMTEWNAIQKDMQELEAARKPKIEGLVPYADGMRPDDQQVKAPANYMQEATQEDTQERTLPDWGMPTSYVNFNGVPKDTSPSAPTSEPDLPPVLSKREQLLQEYLRLAGRDREDLEKARSRDRMLKMGGAIGDALATIVNAQGQKNVKAPGVQVQQGAGLGKIADMFQTSGDVKDDIKSRREDLLAQYKALSDSGELTPYQQQFLALKQKDQELRQQQLGDVMTRHGENLGFREETRDRPSDKQTEAIDSYNQALKSLDRIKNLKSSVDTGPIADIQNRAATKLGINDPQVTALRTEILDTLAAKIKALSGTAASEAEAERLRVTLPSISDSDEVFERQLNDAVRRVEEAKAIRLSTYQKQGKDVGNFQNEGAYTSSLSAAPRREIRQGDNIFDADTKKFIRKAP
jgi:hypothetical protein